MNKRNVVHFSDLRNPNINFLKNKIKERWHNQEADDSEIRKRIRGRVRKDTKVE